MIPFLSQRGVAVQGRRLSSQTFSSAIQRIQRGGRGQWTLRTLQAMNPHPLLFLQQTRSISSMHKQYMKIELTWFVWLICSMKKKKTKQEKMPKVVQTKQFTVALVGRTNVGKSTLFNRLVGRREALVSKEAGTTRDRREGLGHISGLEFSLIDTGGYVPERKGITMTEQQINKQTEYAVEKADIVFFLIDGKVGITNEDKAIASLCLDGGVISRWLRTKRDVLKRPVFVVVNKVAAFLVHDVDRGHLLQDQRQRRVSPVGGAEERHLPAGLRRPGGRVGGARRRSPRHVRPAASVRRPAEPQQEGGPGAVRAAAARQGGGRQPAVRRSHERGRGRSEASLRRRTRRTATTRSCS